MKRLQARGRRGRFVRNTLENTVGLKVAVCSQCRSLNPYPVGEHPPTTSCHNCGAAFSSEKKVTVEGGCSQCGQIGPREPFLDPYKFRQGLLCKACGRDLPEHLLSPAARHHYRGGT